MKKLTFMFCMLIGLFTYHTYLSQSFMLASCSDLGSNTYGPMNSNSTANSKNRTAFIIPSSQLSAISGGTITSTFFKRSTATGTLNSGATFKIYLKNVTTNDFGTGNINWATQLTGAQLVYDSNPQTAVGNDAGWKEFVHSSNFVYTAGNNLAVFVEYVQTTAQTSSIQWNYEYTNPCISTSNSNTTKYVNTTGTFGDNTTTSDYRRPLVSFNVTLPPATVAPGCTTISAPANSATGISVTPTITWSSVANAHSYLVNIGTTPGATDVLNGYNAGMSTSYAIPSTSSLNYSTTYYVSVIPTNNIGNATGCTESSFTTINIPCPSVSLPAASANGTSLKPTITWSAVTGATGYRLSVGTTAGGTDVLNNVDLGNVLTYTFVTNLSPSTQYFYTVNAYQGTTSSASCTERNFTTGATVPPANDDCGGAVTLTVNPTLTCTSITSGNTLGASMSMAAGVCSGGPNDDVWFKFVATSPTHILTLSNIVSTGTTSSITDLYMQILSGTCGNLTSVMCTDSNSDIVTGLTPNETYYVRVYTYSNSATANSSFDICVSTPPAAPANDECAAAVTVAVNPDMSCTNVTSGTTLGGTGSGLAVSPCTGTADDDVWFKFTATATTHTYQLKNIVSVGTSSSTSLYSQIFSGVCGTLTSVACVTSNTNHTVLNGLTVGETYYVRVYNSNTNSGVSYYANTFDMCIGILPPPPANDDCANATSLFVSNSSIITNPVDGSTISSTQSTGTTPTCSATGINDDVWYSFIATSDTHLVHVLYADNATTTQVYSGSCGSLTAMACFAGGLGNSNVLLQNLTVGQTYYVRVFSSTATATTTSTFQIAVTTPSAPTNDTCATAIALGCNGTAQGTNALATDDTLPSSTCGASGTTAAFKGVWFTVTATENGPITIDACGTQYDAYMRVYTGDCTTLTCVGNTSGVGYADSGCPGSNIFNSPKLTFDATLGTTYYVLLTGYTATRLGNYTVTVTQGNCTGLGTSEIKNKESLKAYPNPFTDVLNISDISNVKSISVVDLSGKLVKTFDKPESTLQLRDLNSGMYMVILNMKDGSKQTIKTIKK